MPPERRNIWLLRAALIALPLLVGVAAELLSELGPLLGDPTLVFEKGVEVGWNFDSSPHRWFAALFACYTSIAIILNRSVSKKKWLRLVVIIAWAALFPMILVRTAMALEDVADWARAQSGLAGPGGSWFAATTAVVGTATALLLGWLMRSRVALIGTLAATGISAFLFAQADPEISEAWSPAAWHTLTCAGLSAALWPRSLLGNRCARCRYDLNGLRTDRCPECGSPIHDDSKDSSPTSHASLPAPLTNHLRVVLGAVAFLGTAIYAASFLPHKSGHPVAAYAAGVGISAALSWLILGAVLCFFSRRTPGRLSLWFDACLITMAYGEAVLMLAAFANLLPLIFPYSILKSAPVTHVFLLLIADTVMAACFVSRARRFGVTPTTSLALWILVLNGSFALLMLALAKPLGYA